MVLCVQLATISFVSISFGATPDQCLSASNRQAAEICFEPFIEASRVALAKALNSSRLSTDSQHWQLVSAAEIAWLRYKDAECEAVEDSMRGGSNGDMLGKLCEIRKNLERAAEIGRDTAFSQH